MPAAAVKQQDAVETQAAPSLAESQPEVQVVQPTTKRARVKGTWTMYYGDGVFDFVDGHSYDLPLSLFNYLRVNGNIYDTMA